MFVEKERAKTMVEDDAFPSRVSPLEPLPDIILHSSPSVIRRNRSVSVSLPIDPEVCQRVGRGLRRMSDQFELGREIHRNSWDRRRGTLDNSYRRSS